MVRLILSRRYRGALGFLLLGLAGPWISPSPEPPAAMLSAAQLLPPGTRVREVELAGGGFLRARRLRVRDGGVMEVWTPDGSRIEVTGHRAASTERVRRVWLGTDETGRDVLARLLHGAREAVQTALVAGLLACALGVAWGLATIFSGPWTAAVLSLLADALLGIPRLLLLLILGLALRDVPLGLALALGLGSWMDVARWVECAGRGVMARPFALGVRSAGAGSLRLALRHLPPHLAPVVRVAFPLVATQAILLGATLGFLGAGRVGSAHGWGRIIAEGRGLLPDGWWLALVPGAVLLWAAWALYRAGEEPPVTSPVALLDAAPRTATS